MKPCRVQGGRRLRTRARPGLGFALGGALVLTALAAAGGSPAQADEDIVDTEEPSAPTAGTPSPGSWDFTLGMYGFLTSISGDANVGGVSTNLDVNFWSEVLPILDGATFGEAEAVYQDRWILNVDSFWAQLALANHGKTIREGPYTVGFGPRTFERSLGQLQGSIPVETPVGGFDIPVKLDPGVLRVDVPQVRTTLGPFEIDFREVIIQARGLLGYRVLDTPALGLLGLEPKDDPRRLRVDLLGGIRYWYVKSTVDIESPPIQIPEFKVTSSLSGGSVRVGGQRVPPTTVAIPRVNLPDVSFPGTTFGGTDLHVDVSSWWIDPVVGLRVGADLTENLSLTVTGNVGGFDIGSASKFSWEVLALLGYRLGGHWSVTAGYRGLGIEREKGDTSVNLILHGPQVGLYYRF